MSKTVNTQILINNRIEGIINMGISIQKKWFDLPVKILVNGVRFKDGTTSTEAYILSQKGSASYLVQDVGQTHNPEIVFMVNATDISALIPGQCFILATPFGGTALPCKKISQFRMSLYESNGTIGDYTWSTIPAISIGQADLINLEPSEWIFKVGIEDWNGIEDPTIVGYSAIGGDYFGTLIYGSSHLAGCTLRDKGTPDPSTFELGLIIAAYGTSLTTANITVNDQGPGINYPLTFYPDVNLYGIKDVYLSPLGGLAGALAFVIGDIVKITVS